MIASISIDCYGQSDIYGNIAIFERMDHPDDQVKNKIHNRRTVQSAFGSPKIGKADHPVAVH